MRSKIRADFPSPLRSPSPSSEVFFFSSFRCRVKKRGEGKLHNTKILRFPPPPPPPPCVEEYIDNKKKLVRYKFFKDETHGGRDAVFGLDVPLMRLMNVLQERRAGLRDRAPRHPAPRAGGRRGGPPARLLKKGGGEHSRTRGGALYTYYWNLPGRANDWPAAHEIFPCPMHEEPLRLIPLEWRASVDRKLKGLATTSYTA